MYKNIGEKIKRLAVTVFIIEAIGAGLTALGFIVSGIIYEEFYLAFVGFLVALLGIPTAYVSTWLLYGFGELISCAAEISENTRILASSSSAPGYDETDVYSRVCTIEKMRKQGLLSNEEYVRARQNIR